MKIWIVNHYAIPPKFGGLVRHYYFAKNLREDGNFVKIFTSSKIHNTNINMISNKASYYEQDVDGVEYTFVRTCDYKNNGIERICNLLQFSVRIWRIYKNFEKPDVIYASSPDIFSVFSAILLAKHLDLKIIVEIRDLWPESIVEYSGKSRKNPIIRVLYQLEKWIYKNADKLIFTSAGGADYIKEKGWENKVDIKKVHHINNGVDVSEFDYNKDNYQIDDEDLSNESIFKVVYAGSIRKVNNLGKILECAQVLKEKKSKIKFLIWGDGDEKVILEETRKELGLDNVVFKGRVEKKYIPYILSKADVNLLHWRFTPLMRFGMSANKQFDYMAAGKPIFSDINSNYNLIDDCRCGIVVNNDSVESICSGLFELEMCKKQVLDMYGQNAREACKKFDYKELTRELEMILQDVTAGK